MIWDIGLDMDMDMNKDIDMGSRYGFFTLVSKWMGVWIRFVYGSRFRYRYGYG